MALLTVYRLHGGKYVHTLLYTPSMGEGFTRTHESRIMRFTDNLRNSHHHANMV